MSFRPDTEAALQFLTEWSAEGPWVLTSIIPDGGKTSTRTFFPTEFEACREWIEDRQGRQNVYFMVNPALRPLNSKAKKTDIHSLVCLHVDVDPRAGEDLQKERVRALKILQEFEPRPTVIIDSGGGYQGFWKLDEPQLINGDEGRAEELEAYNQQLEILLGGDHCHNVDRIMRLPGTINVPGEKKRKKGREPTLARVVEADWSREYPLARFTAAARVQAAGGEGLAGPERIKISGNLPRLESVDDLPSTISDRVKMLIVQGDDPDDPTKYKSRSEVLFSVLCELVRGGCDDDTIAAVLMDPDFGISSSVLDKPRPEKYAARQIQRAREEAIDPWLRKLNEKHAVIADIGGKCRVISEVMDHALKRTRISRQSFEDFRNRYRHIKITVGQNQNGQPIEKPAGGWWLDHPQRRQYETIVFSPGRDVEESYNLWKGFACDAVPGECALYLKHLEDNICSGDRAHYEYLLGWMARVVQHPDTPGEVAVVLRGKQGTGKGVAVKNFGNLFGRHFLQVADPKHLVGSFNSHLRDCVVLFADEAFYAGDKKHEGVLKYLITEEMIQFESKGVDAEAGPNYVHLLCASNSQWVVPAGMDDRRYFVLDVADDKMQQSGYFAAIRKEMDNGGREALLHYLMSYDLTEFDVRRVPKTEALRDQKELTFDPVEQWWFEKLMDGRLLDRHNSWRGEAPKNELQEDYFAFAQKLGSFYRRATPNGLRKFLEKTAPDGMVRITQKWVKKTVPLPDGGSIMKNDRPYMYDFPDLKVCRDHWDKNFGGPYKWRDVSQHEEEPDDEEPAPF